MKIPKVSTLVLSAIVGGCTSAPTRDPAQISFNRCEKLSKLEIHSHRGAWDRPENMMSAFVRGVEMGADRIELDLQVSADDQLLAAHDPYMRENSCLDKKKRPVKGKVFFRKLTMDQIREYDCGTLVKAGVQSVPGEQTPTLSEVMATLKPMMTARGRPIALNIEVKYQDNPEYYPSREVYAELLTQAIAAGGYDPSRIMVQSFDIEFLRVFRAKNPNLLISPLLSQLENGIAIARNLHTDLVTPDFTKLSVPVVDAYYRAGIRMIPWTVNEGPNMEQMLALGVDGIITDYPDRIRALRNSCR